MVSLEVNGSFTGSLFRSKCQTSYVTLALVDGYDLGQSC